MSASSETLRALASATSDADGLTVAVGGMWQITAPRPSWEALRGAQTPTRVRVRAEALEKWDSSLLLFLFEVQQWCRGSGADCDLDALPEKIRTLLAQLAASHETSGPFDRAENFLTAVGRAARDPVDAAQAARSLVAEDALA